MNLDTNVHIGDFRIERCLGSGGGGVVYLATQVSLERPVALKVLGPALTHPAHVARFRREAQAIARLDHPAIAKVYYVGQDRQTCYFAMQYIEGVTVREILQRMTESSPDMPSTESVFRGVPGSGDAAREVRFDQATLSYSTGPEAQSPRPYPEGPWSGAKAVMESPEYLRRCCSISRDVALALAHAHERGIVHRDIKPENVMVGEAGSVHVIDFGLARSFEDVTWTHTGALIGTPMYMSPEQVTGRIKVDQRTDIYSLGLMLYELLTLCRPFAAETREALLRQVATRALPPVSKKNRAVSRDLEAVVHKATARDLDERYQSAEEFAVDLDRALSGLPVSAPRYRYRIDEAEIRAERPPVVTAVGFACALIGVFALTGAAILAIQKLTEATTSTGTPIPLLAMATLAVLGVASLVATRGLLSARRWALPLAVAVCLTVAFVPSWTVRETMGLYYGRTYLRTGYWPADAFIGLVYASISIGFLLAVVALVQRKTRDWLRFARKLRDERSRNASL